jgi:CHAD domain-containing protein
MKKASFRGFRIYRRESVADTFRRVLTEQLHQSLQHSRQMQADPDTATHEIRKGTKRIRALYRLYQPLIGEAKYQQGMELYGKISQVLSDYRISRVYLDTLYDLKSEKRLRVSGRYLGNLIKRFEKRHKVCAEKLFAVQQTDIYLSDLITATLGTVAALEQSGTFPDLVPGLQKTYKQCRKNLTRVMQQPTTENLHALRKTIKSLWNQLILIKPVWPSYLGLMIRNLDRVGQKLGQDHDLAEIETVLTTDKSIKKTEQRQLLLDSLAQKRKKLQQSLIPVCRRLLAEKPGAFARKMLVYHNQL